MFYTRDERIAMGKPVDSLGGEMNAAMGGLTDFSSLLDGVDREKIGSQLALQGQTRPAIAGGPAARPARKVGISAVIFIAVVAEAG